MKSIFTFLILFIAGFAISQAPHRCGTDQHMDNYYQEYPQRLIDKNNSFTEFYKNRKGKGENRMIITIPVHVIIVHAPGESVGSGSNFSLEHVQSQIDVLNDDFARTNSDAGNTPPEFDVGDTGIRFQLASQDPNGGATDGITRFGTNQDFNSNAYSIRSQTAWPREDYMNIWVAPNLPYLGLASVPSINFVPSDPINDFIHVESTTFGGPGYATQAPYNLGRTSTHEVGHWLGLFHVWRNGGCGQDDGMDDTPLQDDENFGCPNHPSPSCGNSGDMFMNYMDYVNDNCMNAFTVDQGDYMNEVLNNSRASLQSSPGLNTPDPLEIFVNYMEMPLCHDSSDGLIEVGATGGDGDYYFEISGIGGNNNGYFNDLPADTYVITVEDGNGQTDELIQELDAPEILVLSISNETDNLCAGGSDGAIVATAVGGTGSYLYQLDGDLTNGTGVFTDLENGTYEITVLDDNDCTDIMMATVSSPDSIKVDSSFVSNVSCNGDEDGVIEIFAVGGTGNYKYSKDGMNFQSENIFEDLSTGSYNIMIRDTNNCVIQLDTVINEPMTLDLMASETYDPDCYESMDGSIIATASGGNGSFTYAINSDDYASQDTFENLQAGEYNIYVKDLNDCKDTVMVELVNPDSLMLTETMVVDADCGMDNGEVSVTASGGTGDLSYSLEGLTNMDGMFDGLGSGTYDLEVTDENNCNNTFEITVQDKDGVMIEDIMIVDVLCVDQGGYVNVSASGNGEITYSLSGMTNNTGEFENVASGDYDLIVTDSNGCESTSMVSVEENLVIVTESVTHVSCFGESDGAISVSISGGSGDFEYYLDGVLYSDLSFDNLSAETYEFMLIETNTNCMTERSIVVGEPDELVLNYNLSPDGKNIEISGMGGTEPYLYSSDGCMTTQDSGSFIDLEDGMYIFCIIDANGCKDEVELNINASSTELPDYINNIYLAPNPFRELLLVQYESEQKKNVEISIFDINGRLIKKVVDVIEIGNSYIELDIVDMNSGVYQIQFKTDREFFYLRGTKI